MTWLDENHLLITQKSGEIYKVNTQDFSQTPIKHNIPSIQYGQGMLDIISEEKVYGLLAQLKRRQTYYRDLPSRVIWRYFVNEKDIRSSPISKVLSTLVQG